MKVNDVVAVSPRTVLSRSDSCYCARCMEGDYHNEWTESHILKEAANLNHVSESADERVSELTDDLHTTPENALFLFTHSVNQILVTMLQPFMKLKGTLASSEH